MRMLEEINSTASNDLSFVSPIICTDTMLIQEDHSLKGKPYLSIVAGNDIEIMERDRVMEVYRV